MGRAIVSAAIGLAAAAHLACGTPCDEDPLQCGDGTDFMLVPSCDLAGPLDATLGQGVDEFTPFTAGEEPIVHEGTQGAEHMCLGLRVAEPALDYPQLKVIFDVELNDPDQCGDEPECDPWVRTGHRELVLGPELPLDDDANVEELNLIVVISIWPTDLDRRVRMHVMDPCAREAMIEHAIPAATP